MKCLVIEDEKVAAERLCKLIGQIDDSIEIVGILQSVKKSVEWFNSNLHPELVFMDVQLADGLSFEIFEQTIVTSSIIFTTAYDEYALRAFKVNSIDYLLKPIDATELKNAIEKFTTKHKQAGVQYPQEIFDNILHSLTNTYKSKFVVKVGEHIKIFMIEDIQCFFSMEKATYLQNSQGRNYPINYSLDQLEEMIDPSKFFRINRKYIIAFAAIRDIISYSNSRLQIKLLTDISDELIISRDRVGIFKEWLEK